MTSLKDTAPGTRLVADPEQADSRLRVLVVDDDAAVATLVARGLRGIAGRISVASDAHEALARLAQEDYDVVVSDIAMPGMSGLDLIRAVRARDLDLPVILVTGAPSLEGAATAVELGAFRYLQKPIDLPRLQHSVEEAARLRGLARTKGGAVTSRERSALESAFRRAMSTLRVAYQPIVAADTRHPAGYEALMRSGDPALASPPAVLDAAEKLGALHLLGRRIRNLVGGEIERSRVGRTLFVNLHPADLADDDLYDAASPLSRYADQVVLELTERSSLEGVGDLQARLAKLRALGYRIAVDDLGAGYAGLSYFAMVKPEIVKIDMSLVRDVDSDPVRQQVVRSLVALASGLGMEVVAEGIETASERDTMIHLGCTYVQGYALARPGPAFPDIEWR